MEVTEIRTLHTPACPPPTDLSPRPAPHDMHCRCETCCGTFSAGVGKCGTTTTTSVATGAGRGTYRTYSAGVGNVAPISILERPTYEVGAAAGLLGLSRDRTRAWLDGYERKGKRYLPVIRPSSTGDDVVTWGEFVELGYLREYRRKGVPLQRLRPVINALRDELQTPYPLATAKPYIEGKELVLKLQEDNDLPHPIAIIIRSGQSLILTREAERFFKKVVFDPPKNGDVRRLHPAGRTTPVVIDPLVRFGKPAVDGVAVERLWELHDASESVEEIAKAYDMDKDLINAAITYQEQQRALAA